jgi:hypothetical protein
MKHVIATFDDRPSAEHALQHLADLGVDRGAISLLMSEAARVREFGADGPKPLEGAGVGGAMGGVTGAVIGGLLAVGSIVIPGLGLLAGGPLVAALAGAGAGGAAGTLIGALATLGLSETDTETSARAIEHGKIFVAALVDDGTAERVSRILRGDGGRQVHADAR